MSSDRCCQHSRKTSEDPIAAKAADRKSRAFARSCGDMLGWMLPSAALALLPKCPMCLAAWIAAATGLGVSASDAAQLRVMLLISSVAVLMLLAARHLRRLIALTKRQTPGEPRRTTTLKLPDFWLGGNSLNVAMNCPTMACAGTNAHSLSPVQRKA